MLLWSFSSSLVKIVLGLPWDWEIRDNVIAVGGNVLCKAILYLPDYGSF